jgi:transcription termination/antitermination protein NusG
MPDDVPTADVHPAPAPLNNIEGTGVPPAPAVPDEPAVTTPSAHADPEPTPPSEPPAAVQEEEPEATHAVIEPAPEEEEEPTAVAEPAAEKPAAPSPSKKRWYVVKVQSGREESIKEAIERRVKIEGLEEFFGQIVIPVEKVTEMRNGKRVVKTRKLYPGYLMVEVEYNDRILYLFRETSGVGDFVGASVNRPPPPMPDKEVESMLARISGDTGEGKIKQIKPKFDRGDRVRVRDGTFAQMEGEVKELIEAKNLVRVELTIFGRPVPVELEYWQVETI